MSESLKPMDSYSSRMDIPFNIAAYCRMRKHCPEAVKLRYAIERCKEMKIRLERAEEELNLEEAHLKQCLNDVQAKMERDSA